MKRTLTAYTLLVLGIFAWFSPESSGLLAVLGGIMIIAGLYLLFEQGGI